MKRSIATSIVVALAAGSGLIAGLMLASNSKVHKPSASASSASAANSAVVRKRKILYWWDPMIGPSSISPKPGISAMGMKLVPVYAANGSTVPGEVTINPTIEQNLAVQTSAVRVGPLHKIVRTVGYFRRATPVTYAVTLRVSGWIGMLYASTDGTAVRKGEALFTLYSPQLLAAEEQLLAAAKSVALAGRTNDPNSLAEAKRIYQSIHRRLIYLGVSPAQLDGIAAKRKTQEYLTFLSPVSGYLSRVSVRQRSFVKSGQTLMHIEQLGTVWLDAKAYDSQLPWLRVGQTMRARVAADPGHRLEGEIFFVDPNEDPRTHTVTVRARFANPGGQLRPGMYALVDIPTTPLKETLLAPASAIIHTGTDEVALVAEGKGRFVPRTVRTGLTGSDGMVQVLSGLKAGEQVVTSGQFLIDVESNMNELTTKLTAAAHSAGQAGAHGNAMPGMNSPVASKTRSKSVQQTSRKERLPRPAGKGGRNGGHGTTP